MDASRHSRRGSADGFFRDAVRASGRRAQGAPDGRSASDLLVAALRDVGDLGGPERRACPWRGVLLLFVGAVAVASSRFDSAGFAGAGLARSGDLGRAAPRCARGRFRSAHLVHGLARLRRRGGNQLRLESHLRCRSTGRRRAPRSSGPRRNGRTYWKTYVLDEFDGYAWTRSQRSSECSARSTRWRGVRRAGHGSNPEWLQSYEVRMTGLRHTSRSRPGEPRDSMDSTWLTSPATEPCQPRIRDPVRQRVHGHVIRSRSTPTASSDGRRTAPAGR